MGLKRYSLILYESVRKILEKLTQEEAFKRFRSKGFEPLFPYKNSATPMLCLQNDYKVKITLSNACLGKNPSLWGFNNLENLPYNIKVLLKKKQSNSEYIYYKIITEGSRKRILVHFKCECGNEFDKTIEDSVYKSYICCNECAKQKRGITRRNAEEVINFIENKGYIVLDKTKIYRKTDYIEVEDGEGFKGYINYVHAKRGCEMSRFDVRVNKNHYIDNVNKWAELQKIDCKCIDFAEQKHTRQSLLFRCSCGNEFVTSIASFQSGKIKCDNCAKSISRYEFIFKSYLEELNINYIYQYSLNQCRDILPLPFDFFIKDYNCLIEIDGEGHDKPCNFNQISNKKAQETFLITREHDLIKNNFCKENNIPLLRIHHTAIKNNTYKDIFQNFIRGLANSG